MSRQDGTTVCSDSHRCENYSTCVEYPNNEGLFFCDCDAGTLVGENVEGVEEARYAGLYCEHRATSYCSKGHFCVNDGRCVERRHRDGLLEACDCRANNYYEGPHCEFVKGSRPYGWGSAEYGRRSSASDSGMSPGATAGVVLVVMAVAAGAALFVFRRNRNNDERENIGPAGQEETNGDAGGEITAVSPTTKSRFSTRSITGRVPTDLQLDADGGVLQEALQDSQQELGGDGEEEEDKGAGDDDGVVDVEII